MNKNHKINMVFNIPKHDKKFVLGIAYHVIESIGRKNLKSIKNAKKIKI